MSKWIHGQINGSTVCLKSGNISWSARRAFVCVCFLYNGPLST